MQNLNNSNSIMSRRPGSRSGTPNSMLVLEQGRESPTRPSSGRRSVNRRSPLKRGGSSLEILPAEEEDTAVPNGIYGPRQTHSAGSQSRLGFSEDKHDGNGDKKGSSRTQRRSSSNSSSHGSSGGVSDIRAGAATPDSPRKQVYLTTVKRNFEQHGMPKDEELARAVQIHSPLPNGPVVDSPPLPTKQPSPQKQQQAGTSRPVTDSETHNSVGDADTFVQGSERLPAGESDPIEPNSERQAETGAEAVAQALEKLEVKGSECPRSRIRALDDETGEVDSYYITHCSGNSSAAYPSNGDSYCLSHSKSSSASASVVASPPSGSDDSYYLSHNKSSSVTAAAWPETGATPQDQAEEPTEQAGSSTAPASSNDDLKTDRCDGEDSDEDEDQEAGEEEEEEDKAPFQLLGEFLESVMEEDYENAEKLCKMVLLYEPDNADAKQFQPLIEEMLKREREAQLWGSESDSDEDEDDEDEDEDDDSDDEDSDSDDSDEDSSSEDEDDEEGVEGQPETETGK